MSPVLRGFLIRRSEAEAVQAKASSPGHAAEVFWLFLSPWGLPALAGRPQGERTERDVAGLFTRPKGPGLNPSLRSGQNPVNGATANGLSGEVAVKLSDSLAQFSSRDGSLSHPHGCTRRSRGTQRQETCPTPPGGEDVR